MKPVAESWDRRSGSDFSSISKPSTFPKVDCNYQTFSLDRFYGGEDRNSGSSFLDISREYFRFEARRNFLAEAAFFLVLVAILALTFVSGALTIIHFLQLPAGLS
jgi:hypothetical protein